MLMPIYVYNCLQENGSKMSDRLKNMAPVDKDNYPFSVGL